MGLTFPRLTGRKITLNSGILRNTTFPPALPTSSTHLLLFPEGRDKSQPNPCFITAAQWCFVPKAGFGVCHQRFLLISTFISTFISQQSMAAPQDPDIWHFEAKMRHLWPCLGHSRNALERNSLCYPKIFAFGFVFWEEMPQNPAKSAPKLGTATNQPLSPSTSHLWITKHLSCLYITITRISELLGQVLGFFFWKPP